MESEAISAAGGILDMVTSTATNAIKKEKAKPIEKPNPKAFMNCNRHERRRLGKMLGAKIPGIQKK